MMVSAPAMRKETKEIFQLHAQILNQEKELAKEKEKAARIESLEKELTEAKMEIEKKTKELNEVTEQSKRLKETILQAFHQVSSLDSFLDKAQSENPHASEVSGSIVELTI